MDDKNIFEQLYHFRLESGWKLEDIARHTKVRLKYLQAIESGDWQQIPPIYDRLFFQTYVQFLNVENPQDYLDKFDQIRQGRKTQHTSYIQRKASFQTEYRKARMLKILYLGLPIVIVLVLIVFLLFHSISVVPVQDNGVKEITVFEVADTLRKEQLNLEPVPRAQDSVKVGLVALEKTWFRVIKDMADTTEYLLQEGQRLNLEADSTLRFLVGNAAGLDFTVNNAHQGALGGANEIISYMKITPKGIVAKRLKKIKRKDKEE